MSLDIIGYEYALAAENINMMAVLVAAVASFVVGGLWYQEKTFGVRWQKLVGLKKKDIEQANMTQVFGLAFLLTLVQALFLSLIMSGLGVNGLFNGLVFGLLIGASIGASILGVQYLYARRQLELFAIDAGYIVAQYGLMGLIIAWWQ